MRQGWHWGAPRLKLFALLALNGAVAFVLSRWGSKANEPTLLAFLGGRFPWLSVCLGATFFMHVITLQGGPQRLLILLSVVEVPNLLSGALRPAFYPPFGVGLALVSLAFRAVLSLRAPAEQRQGHLLALFDSVVPPWFCLVSIELLEWTSSLTPYVRDLEIQTVGGVLGPWPPLLVGRLFAELAPLRTFCTTVYALMPLGVALVHAFAFRADPTRRPSLLLAFVLIPLFGYPLYFTLPMVGPREAWACLDPHAVFPPAASPEFASTVLAPNALVPRNCMPSLHTAWTLAAVLEARRVSKPVLAFAWIWFACTELATLGLGEHWLIDLVVAVPFTFAVYAVADGALATRAARAPLLGLAALVLIWVGLLALATRALDRHPLLVAAAMLVTPLLALLLAARLAPSEAASRVLAGS